MTSGERIEAAWRSGELTVMAQGCRTLDELGALFGMTGSAFRVAMNRLRAIGVAIPPAHELLGLASPNSRPGNGRHKGKPKVDVLADDFSDEERTQPGVAFREVEGGFEESKADIGKPDNSAANQNEAPPGYYVKGESRLEDSAGNVMLRWVKTSISAEQRLQAWLDALPALVEPYRGLSEPVDEPAVADSDLLACYVAGDPHFGLHVWGEETGGQSFDLAIAERDMIAAVEKLVYNAPTAEQALFVFLGDNSHADSGSASTTAGTRVDVDTRWPKVQRVILKTIRHCIRLLLEKHKRVHIVIEFGNHDANAAALIGLALELFYENEPRVTVDTSPDKFHWYRFGASLIGITHGDTVKADKLPGVMACDRAKDWGETQHRYWLCGHVHHDSVKEYPGVIVETFRTLAPRDAWHHASGYRSGQDMKVDTYHREWGRVNRSTVGIAQIGARRAK